MTKREDLGLRGRLSSKTGKQGTEHHQYKVDHGGRRLTTTIRNFNNYNTDEIFRNDSRTGFSLECLPPTGCYRKFWQSAEGLIDESQSLSTHHGPRLDLHPNARAPGDAASGVRFIRTAAVYGCPGHYVGNYH